MIDGSRTNINGGLPAKLSHLQYGGQMGEIMLTLTHPGPQTIPRVLAVETRAVVTRRRLTPGKRLIDELFGMLTDQGLTNGIAELSGGTLAPIMYCVPADGHNGQEVSYSETHHLASGRLILGAATLGSRDGKPFMHSHCVWRTPHGELRAGHLWPETLVGDSAPTAVVQGLPGVDLFSADDPETLMPVFTPHPTKDHVLPKLDDTVSCIPRSIIARVCPNEDITTAVEAICRRYNIQNAILRGGIGSLIGATFLGFEGEVNRHVEGPATEVAMLVGHVTKSIDGTFITEIGCTLVDKHGQVHAGQLVPGENLVAVTYDLFVEEIRPERSLDI